MKIKTASATILTLLLISLLTSAFNAQPSKAEKAANVEPESTTGVWMGTAWNKTYGVNAADRAYSLVHTSDGGYALAGYTTPPLSGYQDFWLVKTDSSGNQQWNKTYGDTWTHEVAYSLVQSNDGGGYALAGCWAAGNGLWLVKTDSYGNMEWNKTYDNVAALDIAYSVVQTSDGGYAMAGWTGSSGSARDFWLVKTDSSGNHQWNKTYGGAYTEMAYSLVETSDGGYAIAGFTVSFAQSIGDFWLVKTDSSGDVQWNKTYNYGNTYDVIHSVVETSDGGYALAGHTTLSTYGVGPYDSWLVKTDSSGNMQWNKAYGRANTSETADSLFQNDDGGFVVLGSTDSSGAGGYDCWIVKTDAYGNVQWDRTYGGSGEDDADSLVQTTDGGYAVAGSTNSSGAGNFDFWLVKLTPQTIYIRADGSVDPPTAPIQRNGDLYTLTENIYTSATNGIVIQRNNMTLDGAGHTLQGNANDTGISLSGQSNVTIKNTRITAYYYGILLVSSSGNSVCGNNITSNDVGVYLYSSSNNRVYTNNITNNVYGVWLDNSTSNTVYWNNLTNNDEGVFLYSSSGNTVYGNTLTANNVNGLWLLSSDGNSINGNNITANSYYGIALYISSNTTVTGNNITNNLVGIQAPMGSSSNKIIKNAITNNGQGIALNGSSTKICGNLVKNNVDGIALGSSSSNSISGNNIIENNSTGILLGVSSNSNITENSITSNYCGMWLYSSSNNSIWHNNFENNTYHVYDYPSGSPSLNSWNDFYPSGGNHWSNYNGTDLYSGINQSLPGEDGIGDTPYFIDDNNQDNYPLMRAVAHAYTPQGQNVTATLTQDVNITFNQISSEGITSLDQTATGPALPSGFMLAGQYYDIKTTATYSGKITLRFIYNDTGMSPIVERNLRLKHWNATSSTWEDITTLVDTTNNIIYGETSHLSIFTTHALQPLAQDISVTTATCSKTIVGRGYTATIDVTVRNNGITPKTFDVNVYANATIIGTQTVTDLASEAQRGLIFVWQTPLDLPKGNYTLIVGDYAIGWAIVAMAGDVTGIGTFPNTLPDGKVEIKDFAVMAKVYGINYPDPRYVANYDIDGNGKIEIKDFSAAAKNYGKIDP